MASPSATAESTLEAARQSLIAISQSIPETPSPPNPKVRPPSTPEANGNRDDGAEKYRSKLISISYLSPGAQPTPCPPKNVAT